MQILNYLQSMSYFQVYIASAIICLILAWCAQIFFDSKPEESVLFFIFGLIPLVNQVLAFIVLALTCFLIIFLISSLPTIISDWRNK